MAHGTMYGLYTDGTSFLRASRSVGSASEGAVAIQWLQWDLSRGTAGLIGAGAADVKSNGFVEASATNALSTSHLTMQLDGGILRIDAPSVGNDGMLDLWRLEPVAYASLARTYVAPATVSPGARLPYVVAFKNVSESGADLTVTRTGGATSSAHFTWTQGTVIEVHSDACGGLGFIPSGSGASFMMPTRSASDACAAFTSLKDDSAADLGAEANGVLLLAQ